MNRKNFKRLLMNLTTTSQLPADEPRVICYIPQWENFRLSVLFKYELEYGFSRLSYTLFGLSHHEFGSIWLALFFSS